MSKSTTYSFPTFSIFMVFLILKLTETITWSWWWITAPLWMPWVFILGIFVIGIGIVLLLNIFD